MADLPWDIIIDILSRVPVKDLLRYRSVAKPWRSLIDSRDFINLHLSHSVETTTKLSVLVRGSQDILSFSLDTPSPVALPLTLPTLLSNSFLIFGSCNGLVALLYCSSDLALWNPTTREFKRLPNHDFDDFHCSPIGFGYDPAGDDYKLLRLVHSSATSNLEVYSVKGGSWSSVAFPTEYQNKCFLPGVSVGGTLNWKSGRKIIVAFDLTSEKFGLLPLPNLKVNKFSVTHLEEIKGCLALSVCDYERMEVWVMKEYGVGESWTNLFSVEYSFGVPLTTNLFSLDHYPIAYLKGMDRYIVEFNGPRVVLYDVEKKRTENLTVAGLENSGTLPAFYYSYCVPSLVKISCGDGCQVPPRYGKHKRKQKNM